MKKVEVLYIERQKLKEDGLKHYCEYIKSIFATLGYESEVHIFCETPDSKKINKIITSCGIDVVFCDISLGDGDDIGKNQLGLEIIKRLKDIYPELIVCGISGNELKIRDTIKLLPTFDLFIDKESHADEDYKKYIINELGKTFKFNVGIEIDDSYLTPEDMKIGNIKIDISSLLRLLKRITFSTHEADSGTNVKKITLYPIKGGYSSSSVFRMTCHTENGSTVINSVLKCSSIAFLKKEVNNYKNYVKWYLPYTWRPELLGYAFGKEYGIICYSFAYNGEVPFSSLTDKIAENALTKVDLAINKIFGGSNKQWYSEKNCRTVNKSIGDYYTTLYFEKRTKPYNEVEHLIFEELEGSKFNNKYRIYGMDFPNFDKLFAAVYANKYQECICHGDLNTSNILLSDTDENDDELIFIDFQDTGKGHVFHDFVTFEICLRLYQATLISSDFKELLNNEIKVTDNNFNFADENSIWSRIQEIRRLANINFPNADKNFETYYYSLAMRAFRLFRATKQMKINRTENIDEILAKEKVLLAILLSNLLKLEQIMAE